MLHEAIVYEAGIINAGIALYINPKANLKQKVVSLAEWEPFLRPGRFGETRAISPISTRCGQDWANSVTVPSPELAIF